ncbi:hypothetical protein [Methylophilus luteus]|jgi:hypothetical protein|uniref:Uncharacterized protein n=1 Tax=Methylophilus luteus TaxID=640108 RepID=A0ABW3F8W0_9PROT
MSRIGKMLCIIYALFMIACFAIAYSAEGDFKGQYVFLQLPLALQMAGIDAMGLSSELQNLSWIGAYALLGLPTLMILYFVGWMIDGRSSKKI